MTKAIDGEDQIFFPHRHQSRLVAPHPRSLRRVWNRSTTDWGEDMDQGKTMASAPVLSRMRVCLAENARDPATVLGMSGSNIGVLHRHGRRVHRHPGGGTHRHLLLPRPSQPVEDDHDHEHPHEHGAHEHSHGPFVDRSLVRSRAGVKAVSLSLAVLTITAGAQTAIYVLVLSVALLADLIHNFGDALTAIPLGLAFFLRSVRGERWAGFAVVLTIFVSACVALVQTTLRFLHPHSLTHLWWLAAAGLIGFFGNEAAAHVRLRAGRRLSSPALVADGNHARTDGFVSLGVLASAVLVGLGANVADPIIGLVITLVILRITWQSWRTVSTSDPGEMVTDEEHGY
jgi:Co/Zn/Cd efflux system component